MKNGIEVKLIVHNAHVKSIPGHSGASKVTADVRVSDLIKYANKIAEDEWMEINPRLADIKKSNSGNTEVVRAINDTLENAPEDLLLRSNGIDVSASNAKLSSTDKTGCQYLEMTLTDPSMHGLFNGGHLFRTIQNRLASRDLEDTSHKSFIELKVFVGVEKDRIIDMTEGRNKSRNVKASDMVNARGDYHRMQKALGHHSIASKIKWKTGDDNDAQRTIDAQVLVQMLMAFNQSRWNGDQRRHPVSAYSTPTNMVRYFGSDIKSSSYMQGLVDKVIEIGEFRDSLAKRIVSHSEYRDIRTRKRELANRGSTYLYFLNEEIDRTVWGGWLFPMFASFRQFLKLDEESKSLYWTVDPYQVLDKSFDYMMDQCADYRQEFNHIEMGKKPALYKALYGYAKTVGENIVAHAEMLA